MALSDCPPTIRIVKLGNPDAERDAINAALQAIVRCLGENQIPDQTGHAGEFLTTDGSVLSWGAGGGGGGQASLQFKDEGVNLGTSGTVVSVDFVGAGVVATRVGNAVTATIAGGGAVPTGTGFTHITAGVQDAAAKLVDTADVNNDQITYAKMQNVSATSRVLGRRSLGGGDVEELSIGDGIEISGTVLQGKLSTDSGNGIIIGTDNGLYAPAAVITTANLTLPYASKRQVVTVIDASVTSLSKIIATLGTAPDTAVNADDDIDILSLTTIPTAGSFQVRMNFLTPIGGTLPINYMVG